MARKPQLTGVRDVVVVPEAVRLFGVSRWAIYPYRLHGKARIVAGNLGVSASLDCRGTAPFRLERAPWWMRLLWTLIGVPTVATVSLWERVRGR